ncbi:MULTISPECIES: DUF308 domain-containing protein [Micrococcaceae]|uniref:DUF308 domain-containing protein n=1 Tax=unclassified Kocuria TaxID=2649579 RepID=UPI0010110255|nr:MULTISPECIES: DUF308 domain-containing protein [unclassified Kocuria]
MSAPETRQTVRELRALFGPVLTRALIYLVYGLITVFWQEPTLMIVRWILGLYLIAQGIALIYMQRSLNEHVYGQRGPSSSVIQSYAILYLLGGVLTVAFAESLPILVLIAGLILSICGVTELLQGMRTSATSAMSKDWKIAGLVTFLTGAALFLIGEIGPKAAFGVTGGGAIIVGIFMVLAALTFRHDAAALEQQNSGD